MPTINAASHVDHGFLSLCMHVVRFSYGASFGGPSGCLSSAIRLNLRVNVRPG